ncbi:hypothetical protein SS50377_22915 [Spironucleus salmonicida]|uniref:Transmembrane protein n=1 Tax=Spironucleus salmonicida TaxID=348837 RepID=V6LYG9_9EUKA|nr:hypothetical protein SS50377_22915 [Spironucleus salmonicida]|eukprot:EST48761.1 hypothetical protein SS50377_11083 [Spironucleus salmonicida]
MLIILGNIATQFILQADIQQEEDKYYKQVELDNCYGRNNMLQVNIDTSQMCVIFDMQHNPLCDQIPKGIYLEIQVSDYPDNVIRGQIEVFDYKNDKQICYSCPVIGADTSCKFIQNTEVASITIRSLIRKTKLPVGKIMITHPTYSNCYDSGRSQVFLSATEAKFVIFSSGQCPYDSNPTIKFQIKFYDTNNNVQEMSFNAKDEDGNDIYVEESFTGYFTQVIKQDFSEYVYSSFNTLIIYFYVAFNEITVAKQASISLIQSHQLQAMYQNAIFTVWSDRFIITADGLENSEELNTLYIPQMKRIQLRYQIFSQITQETISNLFFEGNSFNFSEINRGIVCDDDSDNGSCTALLRMLQRLNLAEVDILVHYYFYDDSNTIYLYSSQLISRVENTCWAEVSSALRADAICVNLTQNTFSTQCPYLTAQPTVFKIEYGGMVISQKLNYSMTVSSICVPCASACQQQANAAFKQKLEMHITFSTGGRGQTVTILNTFNQNYGILQNRLLYTGIVIAISFIALVVYYIMKFKVGVQFKSRKAIKVNDEFDL